MSNTDLLQTLEDKYGIDGVLRFGAGPGGLLFADIDNAQARASVCLQGAQLTHWQPHAQGAPVLWLSPAARYAPGSAVRGGIPVCWPWFGPAGAGAAAAPDHGFARTRDWVVTDSGQDPDGRTRLCLRLTDSDATRALWPQTFALDLHIAVGATLTLALVTRNTGTAACSITEALHSYFHVGDIGAVRLLGLEGADYTDKAQPAARARQSGPLHFTQETDRVYDSTADCIIEDALLRRRITITKSGSASTVVWNPWEAKAARLADLGADAWRRLLCVESANALSAALHLAPGASHRLVVHCRVDAVPAGTAGAG